MNEILSADAKEFLISLHHTFQTEREEILAARSKRSAWLQSGGVLDFANDTAAVRSGGWSVANAPADLNDRRVEITGPVDSKMIINALNSGAKVFMADFEDSNSPTWENCLQGQANLMRAVRRDLAYDSPEGKAYRLKDEIATLVVRP